MRFGITAKIAGIVVLGASVIPLVAHASHGKAGLWEFTVTTNMANMPQMSPAQMAQMQAMGVHIPTQNTITVQHCMTAQEVAMDTPPPPPSRFKTCSFSGVKSGGQTYAADMTCTGDFQGQGHYSIAFDSDEHYSGSVSMVGAAHGHPINVDIALAGKWIAADCGGVK